jgi:hypothetical protein
MMLSVAGLKLAEWDEEGGVGREKGKVVVLPSFGTSSSGVDGWRSVEPLRGGGAKLIGDEFVVRKAVGRKCSFCSSCVVKLSSGGVEG